MSKSKLSNIPTSRNRVVILGAGESGVGTALLAKRKGFEVFVSDFGRIAPKYQQELKENDIPYEEGQHTEKLIFNAKEIIKSPGIPDKIPMIKELKKKGIPVVSEIEFAGRYNKAKIVGITGSNGKTTTTHLVYHLLKTAGKNVEMGGNVGYSFARLVAQNKAKVIVLELSSFQLDGMFEFKSDIAILLNITPDHLDRYDYKMENYIASKFRIFRNQNSSDVAIYNTMDENINNYLVENPLESEEKPVRRIRVENGFLKVNRSKYKLKNVSLKGKHNMFNSTAAILAVKELDVSNALIQKGLESFQSVPHRLEKVAAIDGVEYINDSKATNVDAVYYALEAMDKPIIWVVGGTDKGNDYNPVADLVKNKVKAIVCLGVDNSKITTYFKNICNKIIETKSAKEAVEQSKELAEKGDVVLLSPACASFDLFKNYIERGDQFRAAVLNLRK